MRLFICASCLFGLIVPSFETKALTFEELPVKQASKQWEVQIGKAEAGTEWRNRKKERFILMLSKSKTLDTMWLRRKFLSIGTSLILQRNFRFGTFLTKSGFFSQKLKSRKLCQAPQSAYGRECDRIGSGHDLDGKRKRRQTFKGNVHFQGR